MSDVLKNELANDPLARGYSGMDDEAAATSLNDDATGLDRPINIPMRTLTTYLAKVGKLQPIELRSNEVGGVARQECFNFMFTANNANYPDIDINDADTLTMLTAIRAAGLLVPDDVTAIRAMGKQAVSRATRLKLSRVRAGHVEGARR